MKRASTSQGISPLMYQAQQSRARVSAPSDDIMANLYEQEPSLPIEDEKDDIGSVNVVTSVPAPDLGGMIVDESAVEEAKQPPSRTFINTLRKTYAGHPFIMLTTKVGTNSKSNPARKIKSETQGICMMMRLRVNDEHTALTAAADGFAAVEGMPSGNLYTMTSTLNNKGMKGYKEQMRFFSDKNDKSTDIHAMICEETLSVAEDLKTDEDCLTSAQSALEWYASGECEPFVYTCGGKRGNLWVNKVAPLSAYKIDDETLELADVKHAIEELYTYIKRRKTSIEQKRKEFSGKALSSRK